VGDTPVWLIEGEPGRTRVYRTVHLTASRATDSIWITDAYFVAPRSLSEALAAAAQQGVDVRILVPAHNNWPIVGSMSRGGYRFLLESGVRIFEWQGPMIHAKTAVVDGMWCRVGSSNLNTASLMGNWELDVGVLDDSLARQMQGLFLADLASSIEIVLPGTKARRRSRPFTFSPPTTASLDPEGSIHERIEQRPRGQAQGRLTLASLVRAREALGAALAGDRRLGREDRTMLGTLSFGILVIAVIAAIMPTLTGWAVAVSAGWLALSTGARAYLQARQGRGEEREAEERDARAGREGRSDP
jgi:cardiolipin synthase